MRIQFRRSSIAVAVVIATMLAAAGCATATRVPGQGGGGVLVARDGSNGKTIRVGVGDRIAVILASSYWKIRGSSAPSIVRQIGQVRLLAPSPRSCPPGFGCRPVRANFTARAPGTAVITAHRTVCGEALRCVGSRGKFRLTIIVK